MRVFPSVFAQTYTLYGVAGIASDKPFLITLVRAMGRKPANLKIQLYGFVSF
jgi:hypothetical protein